jgi:hypothetical protein
MAQTLVELGARLDLHSNPCGRGSTGTPLELARGGGHTRIAEMLEQAMKGTKPTRGGVVSSNTATEVKGTPKTSLSSGTGVANSLSGHYFSFRTGGNPGDVVDRFEARQTGDRVTYYRNGPVGSKSRVESASAIPMESYSIEGTTLRGVVTGTVLQNGDIEYSHGYTSRKEADSTPSVEHEKPEEDVCSKFEAMPVVLKGCRSCQEHFPKNVDACLGCGKYCYEQNCEGMDVEKCIATDAFKQCDMGCLKKKIPHAFEKPSLVV